MNKIPTFQIKRGATLTLQLEVTSDDGALLDLTGATVACHLKHPTTGVIHAMTVSLGDQTATPGILTLSMDTAGTSENALIGDVKITQAGITTYSDAFRIDFEEPITG